MYCDDYTRGTTDREALPTIEKETTATGIIDLAINSLLHAIKFAILFKKNN